MDEKKESTYSHAGTFLAGIVVSALIFAFISAPPSTSVQLADGNGENVVEGEMQASVIYADVSSKSNKLLVRGFSLHTASSTSELFEIGTSSSMSTASPIEQINTTKKTNTGQEEVALEEEEELKSEAPAVSYNEEALAEAEIQAEALQEQEEVVSEATSSRTLPEGVYVLANGDYVDINGDLISGDPYAYNYKPPQGEENFTTPGGVVMDRFGNILHTPEVVDDSKVLIPPTVVDSNNPPSTISPIYIPRYVITAMNQNPFLTCTQMQLFGNDRALCELRKQSEAEYEWIRVDEIED